MPSSKKSLSTHSASPSNSHPQHEEIALRAYEFFLQRGCEHGRDLDDWLQAERELLGNHKKKPARRSKSVSMGVTVS